MQGGVKRCLHCPSKDTDIGNPMIQPGSGHPDPQIARPVHGLKVAQVQRVQVLGADFPGCRQVEPVASSRDEKVTGERVVLVGVGRVKHH